MSTEQNKQTISKFFERFSVGDTSAALTYLDDAVVWRAMGREGELPISGEMDKKGIGGLIDMIKKAIPKGLKLTTIGWTAEGDRVAAEVESYGELTNGRVTTCTTICLSLITGRSSKSESTWIHFTLRQFLWMIDISIGNEKF